MFELCCAKRFGWGSLSMRHAAALQECFKRWVFRVSSFEWLTFDWSLNYCNGSLVLEVEVECVLCEPVEL
jgi:hypothetical protein